MILGSRGRTSRDVIVRVAARLASSAFQAVTLILIARAAGPADFGIFALVLSLGYLASAITGVGASSRILRVKAETDGPPLSDALLVLRLAGSAVTAGACLSLQLFGLDARIVVSAALLVASDHLIDYAQAYFAGHGRQLVSSLVVVCQRLVPLVGVCGLVLADTFHFYWVAVLSVPVAIGAIAPLVSTARKPQRIMFVARSSIGYWAAGMASNLRQLDPIILGLVARSDVVGSYAIAARMTNPLTIVVSALQSVLVPELAQRLGTSSFKKLFTWFSVASFFYAVLLCIASGTIADFAIWILGTDYADGRALIAAMVVAAGLSAVAQAYQTRLTAEGRPAVAAWVIASGAIVGLVIMPILVITAGVGFLWIVPLVTQGFIAAGMIAAVSFGESESARHQDLMMTTSRSVREVK